MISDCCGSEPSYNGDGVCPKCQKHAGWMEEKSDVEIARDGQRMNHGSFREKYMAWLEGDVQDVRLKRSRE